MPDNIFKVRQIPYLRFKAIMPVPAVCIFLCIKFFRKKFRLLPFIDGLSFKFMSMLV